jgi:hypothetical protein
VNDAGPVLASLASFAGLRVRVSNDQNIQLFCDRVGHFQAGRTRKVRRSFTSKGLATVGADRLAGETYAFAGQTPPFPNCCLKAARRTVSLTAGQSFADMLVVKAEEACNGIKIPPLVLRHYAIIQGCGDKTVQIAVVEFLDCITIEAQRTGEAQEGIAFGGINPPILEDSLQRAQVLDRDVFVDIDHRERTGMS